MRVIEDNFNMILDNHTVVILGSFDGIHLGHRALIAGAAKMAGRLQEELGVPKVDVMVCTFKNHPLSVIKKELCPKLIMDNEEKADIFASLGVDIVNFMNFDEHLMKISPNDFILNITEKYKAKGIVVGFNNRFGYKNQGDVSLLKEMSGVLGYELLVVDPVKSLDEVISSSVIREYLEGGEISKANEYLGRPFVMKGRVIHGRKIGRTIQVPTANMEYCSEYAFPMNGVYGTIVETGGKYYKGITNIGMNPTVSGKGTTIETHILDFDKDIYGENIRVYFIEKLRDEKKFESIEGLKNQLFNDKIYVNGRDYSEYIKLIKM